MSVLPVLTYPNENLKKKADVVVEVNDQIRLLVDDMLETIQGNPNTIALAAPQVGVLKQIIVIKAVDGITDAPLVIINPEILGFEGKKELQIEEGCLSFPGQFATIKRSPLIAIRALNRDGDEFEINVSGILSVVIQHELDHLIGKMFFQRLGFLSRRTLLNQYNKDQEVDS